MALTKLSSSEIQTGAITTELISGDVALSMRIANVSIANSTYTVLDDTAVNVGGGYIVVTGAGFQSGAQVIVDGTPATSTTFVSSTELKAQVGAKSAATYDLFVVNPDGGTAIRVNGLTYSGIPTWVTNSTLDAQNVDVTFNVSFSATGATSYANTTALPAGTTLLANGYFYGTISGIESETTYNFTISAIDNENQDSNREFSLTVAVSNAPTAVEYLVVAGGGGGGAANGSGGGAGGFRTGSLFVTYGTSYTVTVGEGGAGAPITSPYGKGSNGQNSSFHTISATGGGGGGNNNGGVGNNGGNGGSGGGGSSPFSAGTGNAGGYSPSEGNNGGSSSEGGGGGGAGGAGSGTTGGIGAQSSISGTNLYYAGGAAGRSGTTNGGTGLGGGGLPSTNGQPNTGGGGGGWNGSGSSGSGGSGIVIVRYPNNYDDAISTTGSPTFTNTGGYKIYKFTGSGSITW